MNTLTETKTVQLKKYSPEETIWAEDLVVNELPLSVRVNGNRHSTLMCTPTAIQYLVIGHLLSDGVINSIEEINTIEINEKDGVASVQLHKEYFPSSKEKTLTSGCGMGEIYLSVIQTCNKSESTMVIPASTITSLSAQFNKMSGLFMSTGGVHSSALCSLTRILLFHEDIGRHNAVDKLIGEAADLGISLQDKIMLTSGRLASEILIKAAKQGLPMVVSRSAPTSLAIELALRLNITLVGFARGGRLNVYSGYQRIGQ